jgi:hypothetical protein
MAMHLIQELGSQALPGFRRIERISAHVRRIQCRDWEELLAERVLRKPLALRELRDSPSVGPALSPPQAN